MNIFGKDTPLLSLKAINEIDALRNFSYPNLQAFSAIFYAFDNKIRQRMLQILKEKKIISVTELFIALRLDQAVASRHLAVLRSARLLVSVREGKNIYYSLNPATIKKFYKCMGPYMDSKAQP